MNGAASSSNSQHLGTLSRASGKLKKHFFANNTPGDPTTNETKPTKKRMFLLSKRNAISTLDISDNVNESRKESSNQGKQSTGGESVSPNLNESRDMYDEYLDDESDYDEEDDDEEDRDEYESYLKSNINPMSSNRTPLLGRKQNDPFLRDLTACLQAKQQQKKLMINEDSLHINEAPASPPSSYNKPAAAYNMMIKTPLSSRKCILNISCETSSPRILNHAEDDVYEDAESSRLTDDSKDSFNQTNSNYSATSSSVLSLKLNRNISSTKITPTPVSTINTTPLPASQTPLTHSKFKIPSFSLTPVVANESTTNRDETVLKAKPVQLMSFNLDVNQSNGSSASSSSAIVTPKLPRFQSPLIEKSSSNL